MHVSISFRQMSSSAALQAYADTKLRRVLRRHVGGLDVDAHVAFGIERYLHVANFTVVVHSETFKAVEKSEDMYASIDIAIDNLDVQLRRFKGRLRDHRIHAVDAATS